VFQSGFTVNVACCQSLMTNEKDLLISDQLNHASIIDGGRLSQGGAQDLPAQGHGRAQGHPGVARVQVRAAQDDRDGRRLQHGRRPGTPARRSWTWPRSMGFRDGGRRARLGRDGQERPGHAGALRTHRAGPDPDRDLVQGVGAIGGYGGGLEVPARLPDVGGAAVRVLELASAVRDRDLHRGAGTS